MVKHINVIKGVFFFRESEKIIIEMEYLSAIKTWSKVPNLISTKMLKVINKNIHEINAVN